MTTAIVATAILAALVFVLGYNVSRMRGVTAKAGALPKPSAAIAPAIAIFFIVSVPHSVCRASGRCRRTWWTRR